MTTTRDNTRGAPVSFSLRHSIDVATSADRAYRLINAIEEWPDIFPPCRAARAVEAHGNEVLIEITAQVGAGVRTWRSRRRKQPEQLRVSFRQEDPFPPVHSMKGHWQVSSIEAGACRVELVHYFEISASSAARSTPPRSMDDAETWVRCICDSNSESELAAFKVRCERLEAEAVIIRKQE